MRVPDGAGGRRQRAHQVSDVVWNVDGKWGDLRLYWFHWGLWRLSLGLLPAGQRREVDLNVGAGKPERAPAEKSENDIENRESQPEGASSTRQWRKKKSGL